MESRDFSDFEAWTTPATTFPGEVDLRFDIVGAGFALRFDLETRLLDLETKDRRVGFMFKAPLRAIIGAAKRLRQPLRE